MTTAQAAEVDEAMVGWGKRRIYRRGAGGRRSLDGGQLGPAHHAVTLGVVTDRLQSTARGSNIAICLGWRNGGHNPVYQGKRCIFHNPVEAMGLEPANLLTVSHILGVREGHRRPLQAVYQGLLSSAVQAGSAESVPFAYTIAYIFPARRPPVRRPVGLADGALPGAVPDPSSSEVHRSGPRVSGPAPINALFGEGGGGILSSWLRNR
jgi:hypothetical protein